MSLVAKCATSVLTVATRRTRHSTAVSAESLLETSRRLADSHLTIDQLPRGAYCAFTSARLEDCGWRNDDQPDTSPRALWVKSMMDGLHVVKSSFTAGDGFASHAVLRSPSFPSIPYYHSLPHSPLFNSCFVSAAPLLLAS